MDRKKAKKLDLVAFLRGCAKEQTIEGKMRLLCRNKEMYDAVMPIAKKNQGVENLAFIRDCFSFFQNPSKEAWVKLYNNYLKFEKPVFGESARTVNLSSPTERLLKGLLAFDDQSNPISPKQLEEVMDKKEFMDQFEKFFDAAKTDLLKQFDAGYGFNYGQLFEFGLKERDYDPKVTSDAALLKKVKTHLENSTIPSNGRVSNDMVDQYRQALLVAIKKENSLNLKMKTAVASVKSSVNKSMKMVSEALDNTPLKMNPRHQREKPTKDEDAVPSAPKHESKRRKISFPLSVKESFANVIGTRKDRLEALSANIDQYHEKAERIHQGIGLLLNDCGVEKLGVNGLDDRALQKIHDRIDQLPDDKKMVMADKFNKFADDYDKLIKQLGSFTQGIKDSNLSSSKKGDLIVKLNQIAATARYGLAEDNVAGVSRTKQIIDTVMAVLQEYKVGQKQKL